MGRRLVDAVKAWRTRRTRGEIGLRFFLLLAATVFFLVDVLFAAADFDGAVFEVVLFDAVLLLWAGAGEDGVAADGAGTVSTGVCATADSKIPSGSRENIPTKNFTAKLRTQTYLLPKVGAHDRDVIFCETSYYFTMKVIGGSGNCVPVTFLVRHAAFVDDIL